MKTWEKNWESTSWYQSTLFKFDLLCRLSLQAHFVHNHQCYLSPAISQRCECPCIGNKEAIEGSKLRSQFKHKLMQVNTDYYLLIDWRLCCQPITRQVCKSLFNDIDLISSFLGICEDIDVCLTSIPRNVDIAPTKQNTAQLYIYIIYIYIYIILCIYSTLRNISPSSFFINRVTNSIEQCACNCQACGRVQ